MALVSCKECGHSVSDQAEKCQNCGAYNFMPLSDGDKWRMRLKEKHPWASRWCPDFLQYGYNYWKTASRTIDYDAECECRHGGVCTCYSSLNCYQSEEPIPCDKSGANKKRNGGLKIVIGVIIGGLIGGIIAGSGGCVIGIIIGLIGGFIVKGWSN